MMKNNKENFGPARQNCEIYDVLDFRLALLQLNMQGFDLQASASADKANRIHVTCKKTQNRFVIECLGHNEWPTGPNYLPSGLAVG